MLRRVLNSNKARYLSVGAACALAHNVILVSGDAVGLHYSLCILLSNLLVLPPAYLVHANWTFGAKPSWPRFGSYIIGSLLGLIVSAVAVWIYRGFLQLPMLAAAPLSTVTMVIYNFVMTRWAVHRDTLVRAT